jgi:hypothetical protein
MSKTLNVNSGNYTVRVPAGNRITLDTGAELGEVRITGDLVVDGNTVTVNSEDLSLKDNIIKLNDGETGSTGVTLDQSGIQIDRGTSSSYPDVFFVFDENTTHNDPVSQTVKGGTFTFKDENNALIGIRTNSISTGGGDLYLINSGTGVLSVSGTNNYEAQVTDDDDVPNKKYVDDAITTGIQTITIQSIQRGDSALNLVDQSLDPGVSAFKVTIDGYEVALFRQDSTEIEQLIFNDATISTTASGDDLTLSSNGSPFVKIDSVLRMPIQSDATVVASSANDIGIYAKNPGFGNSGVWYKNKNNYEDELISTNKSLLYSMLF